MSIKSSVTKRGEIVNALKSLIGDNFEAKEIILILQIIRDRIEFGLGSDMEAVDDYMESIFRKLLNEKINSLIEFIILADTNIGDLHSKIGVVGINDILEKLPRT